MNNVERELKASLSKEEYETLLKEGNVRPRLQTNYYFCCEDMPKDVMIRIRHSGGKFKLCFKRLLSSVSGVNVCDEREIDVDARTAEELMTNGATPAILKELVNFDAASTYLCAGRLDTYRAKFLLDRWLVELDRNEYLGVVDYELECEGADDEPLCALKDCLRYRYGIVFKSSLPKSARFFNKLTGK